MTSSFCGTGGIVDADEDADAMMGVVACSGAPFEGDFLRDRKPIFVVERGVRWRPLSVARAGVARCGGGAAYGRRSGE